MVRLSLEEKVLGIKTKKTKEESEKEMIVEETYINPVDNNPIDRLAGIANIILGLCNAETGNPDRENGINEKIKTMATEIYSLLPEIGSLIYKDMLTGVKNRKALEEDSVKYETYSRRTGDDISAVYIDIAEFKKINDILGHKTGDIVLKYVVNYIAGEVRADEEIYRKGGDEFVVIMKGSEEDALRFAQRIKNVPSSRFLIEKGIKEINLKIGISSLHKSGYNFDRMLEQAERASYLTKNRCYEPEIYSEKINKGSYLLYLFGMIKAINEGVNMSRKAYKTRLSS